MNETPPKLDYELPQRRRTPSAQAAFVLCAVMAFILTFLWILICYVLAAALTLYTDIALAWFILALGVLPWIVVSIAYSIDQFESSRPHSRHRGFGTLIGIGLGFAVHFLWICAQ